MKLQIKTLNQKSLVLDIEETKTVYELKKELSLYPDIGVKPELQKLIYSGEVLENQDKLSDYNIDVKKFLVVMILKQPLVEPVKTASEQQVAAETLKEEPTITKEKENKIKVSEEVKTPPATSTSTSTSISVSATESEFKTPTVPVANKKDELVSQIVSMGYPESDVRRALAASFYNPERAIEYLIEGIPTTPSTPEGESYTDTDADLSVNPFELFRREPPFQYLRTILQQHPDLLDAAVQSIAETNPALLSLINENQQEFFSMLVGGSDFEEDYDDDMDEDEEN